MHLEEIHNRLQTSKKVGVRFDAKVSTYLAEKGFSADQGARALRHVIQEEIENPLATYLLSHVVKPGSFLLVTRNNNTLDIRERKR